jgi:putative transposase
MPHAPFSPIRVVPGGLTSYRGRPCTVIAVLDLREALVRDHGSGQTLRVSLDQLGPALPQDGSRGVTAACDLATVDDQDWKEAQRRLALIQPLLRSANRTLEAVRARAREGGVHPVTLYRWMARFEAEGKVSALLPSRPNGGRPKGRLEAGVEALTQVTIQEVYLTR